MKRFICALVIVVLVFAACDLIDINGSQNSSRVNSSDNASEISSVISSSNFTSSLTSRIADEKADSEIISADSVTSRSAETSEIYIDLSRVILKVFKGHEDDVQYILMHNSVEESHEVYFSQSKDQIDAFRKEFEVVNIDETEYMESDNEINFYNDLWIGALPYPIASYNKAQLDCVSTLMTIENHKYLYTFNVPYTFDFYELAQQIKQDTGSTVLAPYASSCVMHPSVELVYAGQAVDEAELYGATKSIPLGEFESDNFFLPWIELFNNQSNIYEISNCYGKGRSTDLSFLRGITIYLNNALDNETIQALIQKANQEFNSKLSISHMGTPFLYKDIKSYDIFIIFDEPQSAEMIKAFYKKYQIDSYDYEREPLNIDKIMVFYNDVNQKDDRYHSYTITPDLEVAYHRYEVDFTPFVDETPSSTLLSKRSVSEQDYYELVQILSNYDFRTMPNEIGFGGYKFQQYVYIGVKIDGVWYYSGGDHPYRINDRFKAIFEVFQGKFQIP